MSVVLEKRGKNVRRIKDLDARSHFSAFKRNKAYFDLHYEEFKKKYPNKHVAVYDSRVVAHDTDFIKLIKKLKDEYGDLEAFIIDFVSTSDLELLL